MDTTTESRTFRVAFEGTAYVTVRVEVDPQEEDGPEDMRERAIEKAHDCLPQLCAQCSGWNQPWYLDIPEEWTVVEEDIEDVTDE